MKGGKQPEDLFSHFDFNVRLQSSCWREGAVSGLPHVVVLLSHCFARTYVGIWLYMYMSRYIYICICGQLGSVCLLRTLKFASSSGCNVFCKALYLFGGNIRKNHRPLIDRPSTAHRPLIDHYEKPHRPLFLNIKKLMKTNLSYFDQEMRSMWFFIAVDERSMNGR